MLGAMSHPNSATRFTFKARGRGMTERTSVHRQADAAAHTVALLEELLEQQNNLNEMIAQALNAMMAAGMIPPPTPVLTQR